MADASAAAGVLLRRLLFPAVAETILPSAVAAEFPAFRPVARPKCRRGRQAGTTLRSGTGCWHFVGRISHSLVLAPAACRFRFPLIRCRLPVCQPNQPLASDDLHQHQRSINVAAAAAAAAVVVVAAPPATPGPCPCRQSRRRWWLLWASVAPAVGDAHPRPWASSAASPWGWLAGEKAGAGKNCCCLTSLEELLLAGLVEVGALPSLDLALELALISALNLALLAAVL